MQFLKKSLAAMMLLLAFSIQAQDMNVVNAFSKSYELEYNKKYSDAITALKPAYTDGSYEANLRMGWLHYLSGKYADAVGYYDKAAAAMPAATEPLWAAIDPLAAQEKWNDVEKKYLAILKLDAKNSVANYRLGLVYYYRKDYANANKYFDVALNLYPFEYNTLLMSAWTKYFLNDIKGARALFSKVLICNSKDASALEGLNLTK